MSCYKVGCSIRSDIPGKQYIRRASFTSIQDNQLFITPSMNILPFEYRGIPCCCIQNFFPHLFPVVFIIA